MSPTFRVGLVVGKFSPLHAGHALTIRTALEQCEEVILISYSNPELPGCDADLREAWLRESFPSATVLVVTPERLAKWLPDRHAPTIPMNESSDTEQRDFVTMLCFRILRKTAVDAVFTSETYGDGFAEHLTARFRARDRNAPTTRHVLVDRARTEVPISSTVLRRHPWRNWSYLLPAAARSLVQRVVFLGGESSGKTALAARLADELQTRWVAEYGRELWSLRNGHLTFEDLLLIAREQIRREEGAVEAARAFIFCDTSPLTTLFYSLDLFGRADPELLQASGRSYSIVVLCAPDFPFVQDGTRRDDAFRQAQHAWYLKQLAARDVPYIIASGSLQKRTQMVRDLLGV